MNHEIANDIGGAIYRVTTWFEKTTMYELFTKIPKQKQITYVTHVWRNVKQSIQLGYHAVCYWIYAFFPFLIEMDPSMERMDPLMKMDVDVEPKPEKEKDR